jgi:hypothetical protein
VRGAGSPTTPSLPSLLNRAAHKLDPPGPNPPPSRQPVPAPSSAPPQASGLWGSMMGDEISASARLDRLAAHGIDSLLAVGG